MTLHGWKKYGHGRDRVKFHLRFTGYFHIAGFLLLLSLEARGCYGSAYQVSLIRLTKTIDEALSEMDYLDSCLLPVG